MGKAEDCFRTQISDIEYQRVIKLKPKEMRITFLKEKDETIVIGTNLSYNKSLDLVLGDNVICRKHDADKEDEDNAEIICEAFNVANETGFTPRQLADQNKELTEALELSLKHHKNCLSTHLGSDTLELRLLIRLLDKALKTPKQ